MISGDAEKREEGRLLDVAKEKGAISARLIPVDRIVCDERTLFKCMYGCPAYNRYLTCPPLTPSQADFARALSKYEYALLVEANPLELNELVVELENEAMRLGHYFALGLKAGPCLLCSECVQPGEPCREPLKARPSMEALGVNVFATLKNIGIEQKLTPLVADFNVWGLVLIG
jgi:predicted metal-binding protein